MNGRSHFADGRARPPRRGCPSTPAALTDIELNLPGPYEESNVAMVSGRIVEEPFRDRSRGGDPVTVLLIAFKAPDEEANAYSACLEVEVPDSIAESRRHLLRIGRRLVVIGRLTGAGGLWATALIADEPRATPEAGR